MLKLRQNNDRHITIQKTEDWALLNTGSELGLKVPKL